MEKNAITPLNKWQSAVFIVGALLTVAGAATGLFDRWLAPWLFVPGVLCYVSMQMLQRYEGRNLTLRRLRRIMIISDLLLVVAAVIMVAGLPSNPFSLDYLSLGRYMVNGWVVVLLIAAVLQLYTIYRIDMELKRDI